MKLLLISNSGRPYLVHCLETLGTFFKGCQNVGFVPAASFIPQEEYAGRVKEALKAQPFKVTPLDLYGDFASALSKCDGVMIGGGNTYKLLKALHDSGAATVLRDRARAGMPLAGWSAGSNVMGPTVLTTNDWNVVGHPRFDAMALVPFNINPHYKETDAAMAQFSETRDERIAEYHKVHSNVVLGIEEQTMIWAEGGAFTVMGTGRVRRFLRGQSPSDFRNGERVPA